jgi:gliding motility-associated-like protein
VNGIYQDLTSTPVAITFPSPVLGDTTYIVNLNISNQCGARDYQEEFLARPTPVSSFSADTYMGCSPFVPVFTNSSYGSPDSYTWIFSDGFIYNDSLPVGHGLIAINNDTTNYTVIFVTQNACGIDSAMLNFVALPNTIVSFFNTIPQFGCAPLPVTMSNYSSGATDYLWNFGDGSAEVSTYNASHVFQEGGNYIVSLIATDGCSIDTAYSNITVFPRPAIDFIPDEDVICQGSVLGLTNLSQGAVAYLWDFGNNETSASFEPNYTYDTPGNYTVQLIGYSPVFGCPDTLTLPIEVRNIPQLNIDVDPMMGCMPLNVNFFNNTLYTSGMEWDFGNGLSSTSFNPSTNYYQFGEYPVNITAHNYSFANNLDCPIDTQIVISVFPKPTSSFTLDSYASCGLEASVNVVNASQGGLSYLWKWQEQSSFEFEPIIAINDTGNIQIDLMVSNEFSCMDTTSNIYVLTAQPKANLNIEPPIGCEPLNVTFSALDVYGDAWIWNFGDGVSSQQGPDVLHEYENDGKYTLTLQVGNNNTCFDDTTITQAVVVNPRADAKFKLDKDYISADYPVIGFENQSTEASIFTLDVGDGAVYNNFVNQHIYQNVIDGEYDIQLIANNQYNCPDTAYKTLKVEPTSSIYIPNSFTPNGDGKNELFGPEFIGDPVFFDFLIFDRWGHVIFETFDKNVKWNGTFKNQDKEPIKQDVYVYKLVIGFGGSMNNYKNITGRVTVIY